jgi:hypothetical protein
MPDLEIMSETEHASERAPEYWKRTANLGWGMVF